MPVIHPEDAVAHQMHGATFTAYVARARGSSELCAWHVAIPAGTEGVPHHVTREEVLFVLAGTIRATVDGQPELASAGAAVMVPAGANLRVDNPGGEPASAWVTTSVGFACVLPDGSWVAPPWTR
jgi:quercetin dioxygenase-like cupin family protein